MPLPRPFQFFCFQPENSGDAYIAAHQVFLLLPYRNTILIMSATAFPSIISLLDKPTSSFQHPPSLAEMSSETDQSSLSPAISPISPINPPLDFHPAISDTCHRAPFTPHSRIRSPLPTISTVSAAASTLPVSGNLLPPIRTILDNNLSNDQRTPDKHLEDDPIGPSPPAVVGSTYAYHQDAQIDPNIEPDSPSRQIATLDTLLNTNTQSALALPHSILSPHLLPPTFSMNISTDLTLRLTINTSIHQHDSTTKEPGPRPVSDPGSSNAEPSTQMPDFQFPPLLLPHPAVPFHAKAHTAHAKDAVEVQTKAEPVTESTRSHAYHEYHCAPNSQPQWQW